MANSNDRLDQVPSILPVLGRDPKLPDSPPTQRGEAEVASQAAFDYATGATGTAEATVYRGKQDLDRGGMILRLAIKDKEASFLPTATINTDGVDIHIGGEAEAEAMVIALQTALLQLNADRARKVGVNLH